MTALVLGARVDLKPPRTLTEAEKLQPLGNLLIDLAELSDAFMLATEKRSRIASRLDDPGVEATREQRMQAEAKASALFAESLRHQQEIKRKAALFMAEWKELDPELKEWIQAEVVPMACWARVWPLLPALVSG